MCTGHKSGTTHTAYHSTHSNINATRLTCRNMATNMPVDQMTLL